MSEIYGYIKNLGGSTPPPTTNGISAMPLATGQTTSYHTGDDGDTQRGRPFFTMPIVGGVQQLNHFGSKWRFTGVTGGYYDRDTSEYKDVGGVVTTKVGAFPDYTMLDHSTIDWNNNILHYWFSVTSLGEPDLTWNEACDYANILNTAIAPNGFNSGWYFANEREVKSLTYQNALRYEPLSVGHGSIYLLTSTTAFPPTDPSLYAMYVDLWAGGGGVRDKSLRQTNYFAMYVRKTNISEL